MYLNKMRIFQAAMKSDGKNFYKKIHETDIYNLQKYIYDEGKECYDGKRNKDKVEDNLNRME